MTTPAAFTAHDAAAMLEQSPDFRVLRRFIPREHYNDEPWNLGDSSPARLGVYVDVETTGLDTKADEIIELSLVAFTYNANDGIVYDVRPAVSFFEEPKRPIKPEITELTGITSDMVRGQRINEELVTRIVDNANIVIAHSARFDRPMCERRLGIFAERPWACSQVEVPWKKFGVNGGALGNVLMSACGEFVVDAHRAATDCYVGVHVLAAAILDGRSGLSYLLESARQPTLRVCAIGSPIGAKEILRSRGYRALYNGSRFAYWYKDLRDGVDEEMLWCRTEAYADPEIQELTARDRYSIRAES